MKKLAAMLLSVMMVFLFTACGGGNNDSEPAPADEPTPQTSEVSGIVEDLTDGELSIYTQAKESLTFNIENAEIDTEDSIESGDTATVEYTGKISDGHTEDCEVSKVTNEKGTESKLEGKVKEISQASGSIMITSDNKDYLFDVSDAREEAAKAAVGATVELKYTGLLENTDTTHAYMKTLKVTKAPEKKRVADTVKVKAVDEKVWTTKKVKIMDDTSKDAKKLGKVKKGTKLKRTGVLENGWSRVIYKDKDAFVKTKTLSTKKPKAKEDKKVEVAVAEKKTRQEKPRRLWLKSPRNQPTRKVDRPPRRRSLLQKKSSPLRRRSLPQKKRSPLKRKNRLRLKRRPSLKLSPTRVSARIWTRKPSSWTTATSIRSRTPSSRSLRQMMPLDRR